ncbi:MAG: tRNA pseudouridine synthase A, partial [Deltaproteobacteria bacterium]|nr:tRNA pseudouridine synthase A [Deltaproteobacteria bacterium]
MPNFKLVLEYDGSDFAGWQLQAQGQRTVQGCLVAALERICGDRSRVTGSGRTDAGVHAEGQVASVRCETRLAPDALRRAINGNLPRDVVVLRVEAAPDHFDARRHACSKLYRYRIWNGRERSPLRARSCFHVPTRLAGEAVAKAAGELTGTHDFASFQAAGSVVESSVRTIYRLELLGEAG